MVCCVNLYVLCACVAGSRFWQSGSFEVSKADAEAVDTSDSVNGCAPRSAVQVTVLTELEGVAYIQVAIRDCTNASGSTGN